MVSFSEKENIGGHVDLNKGYQEFDYGRVLSHFDELILISESIC